mgnify:CR=1 FL=1
MYGLFYSMTCVSHVDVLGLLSFLSDVSTTTEIYTKSIVGSVRCVYATGHTHRHTETHTQTDRQTDTHLYPIKISETTRLRRT